ncbi:enoyl-CoA hydratase/isomerase family protein [Neoaquamicrobium sediminum]|uniref:enoyl-CoA hydratase/isomerase family protein n=1 Tax=Neoaquamicrobium sediminum TaxID=1849104 RepID=UPI003BAA30A9
MSEGDWTDLAGGELRLRLARIATIELNAPARRNAMSAAMWRGLREAVGLIAADEGVRVVLVRGAGGKAFSAGAHIGEFEEVYADADSARAYNDDVRAAQAKLRGLPRPTVAVIEGACVGGGCGLALACDLRFAAETARLAITPARLGLAYSYADTAQLVEKVGPARAKDILFSARLLPAPEALSIGLVDRVVPADALEAESAAYAEGLAALSQSSIRAAKAMINRMSDLSATGDGETDALFASTFAGPDFQEGYRAFLEKRPPAFR